MKKIRKTDIVIIIAIAIVFLLIIVTNSNLIFKSMMNQTQQIGEAQINSIKTDFENYITNAENSLIKVSSGAEQMLDDNNEFADKEALEKYIIEQKQAQINASNGVNFNVYIAGQGWEIIPDFDAPADYHATERNWYIGAVDNAGEIYITDPYIDSMTGEMCYTMSVLLSDNQTVVAMDFTLSEIQQSVEKMSLSNGSSAMIVTSEGLIVGYSDMSYVGKDLNKALPVYIETFDKVLESQTGDSFKTNIDGKRNTIFYSMTKNNWYMILCVDSNELYSSTIRQVTINVLINVFMLALIVILYVFTARNRIKSEEAVASRELFVEGLMQKLREPLDNINSISNRSVESSHTREDYASIKTSVLKMNDLMNDLNSYSTIVNNAEKEREKKRQASRDLSKTIRLSRNVIVFLLIIILISSSIFYYRIGRKQSKSTLDANLNYYENQFEQWEQEQMTILSVFTDAISAKPELMDDYESAVEWMNQVAKNYPSISVCYLANPYNEHTVIMNNGWQPDEDWKVEERDWYKATEKSSEGYSISAPYYDEQTGNYCITISKIVYGKNGEFLGIFGIDLYMDKIISIFGDSYTDKSYVFLVDSNGDIINHPNDNYQMANDKKVNYNETPYSAVFSNEDGEMIVFDDYDGVKKCCEKTTDESTGISVLIVYNWIHVYLYQMAYATFHGVFILAVIIAVIVILNKVIISQTSMNARLSQAVNEAEAAGKAKSDFLAQMSHEIRTPINAVIGMDEMILRETEEPNIREYAMDIKSASKTLLTLINGVLDFSKIESGKMEIIPAKYDVTEMIDGLVNMISERAEKKSLSLKLNIDEMLPKELYGDDVKIRQVITNLLTNAVKYTEKGEISLIIKVEELNANECTVFVDVKDTGIGIKEEDMEKLFQSFKRLDEKKNRTIEGTGLGMSIVDGILTMMGSKLEVKSEYGKGSSFSFRIRQSIIDSTPIGIYEYHRSLLGVEDDNRHLHINNADILAVDDNEMNLKVVQGLMKRLGVKPDLASSGQEAIDMIRVKHYDIVLMDHMMPGMDGIDTLHNLMDEALIDDTTTVIALTANAISGAKEKYISEGFKDYLSKPINPDELENTLVAYLPEDRFSYDFISEEPTDNEPADKENESGESQNITGVFDFNNSQSTSNTSGQNNKNDSEMINRLRENGFNVDAALKYAIDDVDFYKELLETFVQSEPEKRDEIQKNYEQKDWKEYKVYVHALKSASRTIGADNLSEMALEQENASKNQDEALINQGYKPLLEEYSRIVSILKDIVGISSTSSDDTVDTDIDDDMERLDFFPEDN